MSNSTKRYPYDGKLWSIPELLELKECIVEKHELERNLWRHKLSVREAIRRKIKSRRHRCSETHRYMGRLFTSFELLELEECVVSYQVLRKLLRQGVPAEYAILNQKPPENYINRSRNPKPLPLPKDQKAYGSQISILNKKILEPSYRTYEYSVLESSGNYVLDKNGINIEKTIDKIIK